MEQIEGLKMLLDNSYRVVFRTIKHISHGHTRARMSHAHMHERMRMIETSVGI